MTDIFPIFLSLAILGHPLRFLEVVWTVGPRLESQQLASQEKLHFPANKTNRLKDRTTHHKPILRLKTNYLQLDPSYLALPSPWRRSRLWRQDGSDRGESTPAPAPSYTGPERPDR
jgi:hypothetical protein